MFKNLTVCKEISDIELFVLMLLETINLCAKTELLVLHNKT